MGGGAFSEMQKHFSLLKLTVIMFGHLKSSAFNYNFPLKNSPHRQGKTVLSYDLEGISVYVRFKSVLKHSIPFVIKYMEVNK